MKTWMTSSFKEGSERRRRKQEARNVKSDIKEDDRNLLTMEMALTIKIC